MAFTKIVGAGIHTLSNVHTHNINSSGIITATQFVGLYSGTDGDFSGNVTIDGNLIVNGDTTTLNTTLREVEILRVDANNSTVGAAITQSGSGDILNLYDGSTEVFSVADGGVLSITGTGSINNNPSTDVGLRVTNNATQAFSTSENMEGTTNRKITPLMLRNGSTSANTETYLGFDAGNTSKAQWNIGIKKTGALQGDFIFNTRTGSSTSAERLRITSSGVLKINRGSAINEAIDIDTTATTDATRIRFVESGTAKAQIAYSHANDQLELIGATGNAVAFFTDGTQKFSMDSDGKLSIAAGGKVGFATDSNTYFEQDGLDRLSFTIGGLKTVSMIEAGTSYPVLLVDKNGTNTYGTQGAGYNSNANSNDLVIGNVSSGNHGMTICSPSTGLGNINFSDGSGGGADAYKGSVGYNHSTEQMIVRAKSGTVILKNDATNTLVATGGKVGIGTDNPSAKLEIVGSTTNLLNYSDGQVQIVGNNPIAFVSQSNLNPALNRWGFKVLANNVDGNFSIYDYRMSAHRLLITSAGNIGIGSLTPQAKLDILNTSANADISLRSTSNSFNSFIFDSGRIKDTQFAIIDGRWKGNSVARIQFVTGSDDTNYDDGYMAFHTRYSGQSLTERLRIKSDGTITINSTGTQPSTTVSGYQFDGVAGTLRLSTGAGSSGTTSCSISIIGANHNSNIENGANSGAAVNLFNANNNNGNSTSVSFHNADSLSSSRILGLNVNHATRKGDLVFMTSNGSHPTEKARITSGGNALFGGAAVSQTNRQLVVGSNAEANLAIETHNTSASETANIRFYRSRGTAASPTTLVDNDVLSQLMFYGHDGTDYAHAAGLIRVKCNGTVAGNQMPGEMSFHTNHGTTYATERLKIQANGYITMGEADFDASNDLHLKKANSGGDVAMRITNNTSNDASTASLYFTTSPTQNFNTSYIQAKRDGGKLDFGYSTNDPTVTMKVSTNVVGVNNSSPEGVGIDVHSSRTTAFSATADQRGLAHLILRNSSDAPNRFSSLSFVSGGGTQAEGSINLVQTGNYTGDMTFKMRNGSGSNDWVQAARFMSDGDFDFNKFEPDGTITTTLSSNSSSGNYTTIIPLNTSGIGHLHVYLVSIHWSFNSNGGTPYYCSGAVLWQTPHSNGVGTNYPIPMLSSCHVGGNYYLNIRNQTGSQSYPGLQAANMNWTALAGSHYIVKYKRIY